MYCLCPQLFMYIWKVMCPPSSSNVLFHFFPFYFVSFISSVNYGGPKVSRQKSKAHDKRKMLALKKKQVRAKEKNSRQKKDACSKKEKSQGKRKKLTTKERCLLAVKKKQVRA